MPCRSCSVPSVIRRVSSPAGIAASTAAARRKACTRYVGALARSSSKAIRRSADSGSIPHGYTGGRMPWSTELGHVADDVLYRPVLGELDVVDDGAVAEADQAVGPGSGLRI